MLASSVDIAAVDVPERCMLCSHSTADSTLQLGRRALVACRACGLVRLSPVPTAAELSEVYDAGAYYTQSTARLTHGVADRVRQRVLQTFWGYPSAASSPSRMLAALLLWPLRNRVMPVRFQGAQPVLDIGCGNGQRLLELQSSGCTRLYGVEPTEGAARQARLATKAEVHTGLLEDAELPDSYFQLVILNQVLEHVPAPRDTLRRIHRLLRPGGELYLTVPNYGSAEAMLFGAHWHGLQIPTHLHHFTPRPLRRFLEEAGFEVVVWRTDTALGVTRCSIETWAEARPSRWRRWLAAMPVPLIAPFTTLADLAGRGQMLRVVARKT